MTAAPEASSDAAQTVAAPNNFSPSCGLAASRVNTFLALR